MSNLYARLSERIRGEIVDLDHIVYRALSAWQQLKSEPEQQDICMDSVALNLHSLYSGIERLFELIARDVDRSIPSGEMWHRDLVRQMAEDLHRVRPSVIDYGSVSYLDSLRRFRHLVRNVYSFNLVPDRVEPLIEDLPVFWGTFQKEMMAFAGFLAELALKIDGS